MRHFKLTIFAVLLTATLAFGASGLTAGKVELKSAGALAFGPDGILFIGDALGATVFAIDTEDRTAPKSVEKIDIRGVNQKIADLLGTAADQIVINDVAINPISKKVYLSVSRGRGPDAVPVILRTDSTGKISQVSLTNVRHSMATLPNPAESKEVRGRNQRLEAITDMAYADGRVFIAGLSNEEFSSNLRSIPYPFEQVTKGANIEIYHGSHGRFETNSPVRTFLPYTIDNQKFLLAAYTCTPLVKISIDDLKAGSKVKGTTIAELGNRNSPLDMIAYKKDGHDFILMANSSRGVMKLQADKLGGFQPIVAHTETAGVPYETIASLKGVQQLDKLDEKNALILTDASGTLDLVTIALP
ncbi:MAG TPA: hypothetical protein VGP79_13025 [Bryobacteraceae bacterium]|jgi:hypothetical protein|nr:hypothetical protein [Bryobacteraceae bacterium]